MSSDISQILIQSLIGLLYAIPTIILIIISIYYIVKMGSTTDAFLILIGNIIVLLCIVIGRILFIQLAFYQMWQNETYSYISTVIGVLSFIGNILFVIGIFFLIKRVIKTKSLTT